MPSFSDTLDFGLRLAIVIALCMAVVAPISTAIWLWTRHRQRSNRTIARNGLMSDTEPDLGVEGKDDAHRDGPRYVDPVWWELRDIKVQLESLMTGVERLQDGLLAYCIKNFVWAVVGAVIGLMLQELWGAAHQPEPRRPNFVDFSN